MQRLTKRLPNRTYIFRERSNTNSFQLRRSNADDGAPGTGSFKQPELNHEGKGPALLQTQETQDALTDGFSIPTGAERFHLVARPAVQITLNFNFPNAVKRQDGVDPSRAKSRMKVKCNEVTTTITNLLVAFGAYLVGSLIRLAIIAAMTPFGGYSSGYREDSLSMYVSSLTADIPLLLSGITAGFLCGRFTIGRDFGWASIPALIYLVNAGGAFFREQTFQMWLIMTGLPSTYAAIVCVGAAYWASHRQAPTVSHP